MLLKIVITLCFVLSFGTVSAYAQLLNNNSSTEVQYENALKAGLTLDLNKINNVLLQFAISTSKPSYKFGEIVNITIRNTGTDPLTFPNSILGLKIENSVTHKKYPLFAAQVITVLDSGGVKSLKWNQQDSGQQVKEGNYTASTSTGYINASTTFAIVK